MEVFEKKSTPVWCRYSSPKSVDTSFATAAMSLPTDSAQSPSLARASHGFRCDRNERGRSCSSDNSNRIQKQQQTPETYQRFSTLLHAKTAGQSSSYAVAANPSRSVIKTPCMRRKHRMQPWEDAAECSIRNLPHLEQARAQRLKATTIPNLVAT